GGSTALCSPGRRWSVAMGQGDGLPAITRRLGVGTWDVASDESNCPTCRRVRSRNHPSYSSNPPQRTFASVLFVGSPHTDARAVRCSACWGTTKRLEVIWSSRTDH